MLVHNTPLSTARFAKSLLFLLAVLAANTANAFVVTQWTVDVDSTFDPSSILDSNAATPGDVIISNGDTLLQWGDTLQGAMEITNSPVSTTVTLSESPTVLPPVGNVFLTHTNMQDTGTYLDQVTMQFDLTLAAAGSPPGAQAPVTLTFLVDFYESVNTDPTCADGFPNGEGANVNGCGDLFVISADALNYSFTYDAGDGDVQQYFVSLVELGGGLSALSTEACLSATGSSDPCLGFVSPEDTTNTFEFGTIISNAAVEVDVIPAPGVLSLMGLGLATLAGVRRRREPA